MDCFLVGKISFKNIFYSIFKIFCLLFFFFHEIENPFSFFGVIQFKMMYVQKTFIYVSLYVFSIIDRLMLWFTCTSSVIQWTSYVECFFFLWSPWIIIKVVEYYGILLLGGWKMYILSSGLVRSEDTIPFCAENWTFGGSGVLGYFIFIFHSLLYFDILLLVLYFTFCYIFISYYWFYILLLYLIIDFILNSIYPHNSFFL